jgi:hypothetical protein
VRSYDRRDKRQGDFGVGWTLGINDIRLQKTGSLGAKCNLKKQVIDGPPTTCLAI